MERPAPARHLPRMEDVADHRSMRLPRWETTSRRPLGRISDRPARCFPSPAQIVVRPQPGMPRPPSSRPSKRATLIRKVCPADHGRRQHGRPGLRGAIKTPRPILGRTGAASGRSRRTGGGGTSVMSGLPQMHLPRRTSRVVARRVSGRVLLRGRTGGTLARNTRTPRQRLSTLRRPSAERQARPRPRTPRPRQGSPRGATHGRGPCPRQ